MTLFQLDFFIFMLILMLVVGGFCVLVASSGFSKADKDSTDEFIESKLDVLGNSVNEADEAISELNDMSRSVFKEFDSKYQELLFLYNLIDEKQKGALNEMAAVPAVAVVPAPPLAAEAHIAAPVVASINPKFTKVLEMHRNGKSVEEIAIEMDMGKGEIGLILTLGGGRSGA